MGSDYFRLPRNSVMASRAYEPGEYFCRSVVAKLSEQSSEQSEDNSIDISREDLDDNQLSTRVRGKAARLGKMWKRACLVKNQRSHRENEKRPSRLNPQQQWRCPEVHGRIQN